MSVNHSPNRRGSGSDPGPLLPLRAFVILTVAGGVSTVAVAVFNPPIAILVTFFILVATFLHRTLG